MIKLIINADDLGISHVVNSKIEEGIKIRVISSCTLMANAPAFQEGVNIAKKYSNVSVGVHLNLVEFSPLTNIDIFKKHGIADETGNFIEGAVFVKPINDELKNAIFEEWDAQIEKVKSTGIIPTHCDSHQHTHTITSLQEVLKNVLQKHNIQKVRRKGKPSIRLMLLEKKRRTVVLDKSNAVQPIRRNVIYRRLNLFVVKWECHKWNVEMRRHFLMTDCFFAFRHFYHYWSWLVFFKTPQIVELMCHPGHKSYDEETMDLFRNNLKRKYNCELISYKDI